MLEIHYSLPHCDKCEYFLCVSIFTVRRHKFNIYLQQGLYQKETPLVIETNNFTVESLGLQNRQLNGAHSVSDIKLPC